MRLQRRRHLRSLNRRRMDRQKEQKAEYEFVSPSASSYVIDYSPGPYWPSVLQTGSKRWLLSKLPTKLPSMS